MRTTRWSGFSSDLMRWPMPMMSLLFFLHSETNAAAETPRSTCATGLGERPCSMMVPALAWRCRRLEGRSRAGVDAARRRLEGRSRAGVEMPLGPSTASVIIVAAPSKAPPKRGPMVNNPDASELTRSLPARVATMALCAPATAGRFRILRFARVARDLRRPAPVPSRTGVAPP